MSKMRWPEAAVNMTFWIAIALVVYSLASCFSQSIQYRAKSAAEIKAERPEPETPRAEVKKPFRFHLVEENK